MTDEPNTSSVLFIPSGTLPIPPVVPILKSNGEWAMLVDGTVIMSSTIPHFVLPPIVERK